MSQKGNNKYMDGSLVVNESITTKEIITDVINGTRTDEYITTNDIPNAKTLEDFEENDGGLLWNGIQLIPPNSVQTDRPYAENEIKEMITAIWDKYDGSIDDSKVDESIDPTKPGGNLPSDWRPNP